MTTDLSEPNHIFEARIKASLDEARDLLAGAEAAEAAASIQVDHVRGEASLGRASRADVLRAQRALARAQEESATASARIRALERDALKGRTKRHDAEQEQRRRIEAEVRAERAAIGARIRDSLRAMQAELAEIEEQVRVHNASSQSPFLGPLYGPSNYAQDFGRLTDSLARLINHYR